MTDTIPEDGDRPYWLPDWLYQILKWVGLAFLPLLGAFVHSVGPVWGLPHTDAIVTTIYALGVLIAGCIAGSQAKAALSK
ncbi:holin [Bifidobacterium sp. B4081]|uniref:phage holin n=1 Tax=unclassified Bifidobacterium TaxID=2608897 RepID=UPI0022699E53|nr:MULTISPECIES: phage holin [unclassified Bifidobacterium]MCX8643247.1 holin [Bifidobacterium sp. B4077]MCX8645429.1 holin [Bifidobacterium sp. B4081]MCX8668860.1 holin [Bifidobacterium sp. B3998]